MPWTEVAPAGAPAIYNSDGLLQGYAGSSMQWQDDPNISFAGQTDADTGVALPAAEAAKMYLLGAARGPGGYTPDTARDVWNRNTELQSLIPNLGGFLDYAKGTWDKQQQMDAAGGSDFGGLGLLASFIGPVLGVPWLSPLMNAMSGNFSPMSLLSLASGGLGGGVAPDANWADSWGDIGGLPGGNVPDYLSGPIDYGASFLNSPYSTPAQLGEIASTPAMTYLGGALGGGMPSASFATDFGAFGGGPSFLGGSSPSSFTSLAPGGFRLGGAPTDFGGLARLAQPNALTQPIFGGSRGGGMGDILESIFGPMDPEMKRRLGLGMGGASLGLGLLSGVMGLKGASDIRGAAGQTPAMAPIYDPFASQRGQYQQQLSALASNPSRIFDMPGYKAGEQALMRQLAAGGFLGSGNMMTALRDYGTKSYGEEFNRLAGLAGANIGPMVAGSAPNPYAGAVAANDATSKALASLGYLARMW